MAVAHHQRAGHRQRAGRLVEEQRTVVDRRCAGVGVGRRPVVLHLAETGLDDRADVDIDLSDPSIPRRRDLILHFHCLQDDQGLTLLNLLAKRNPHVHDSSGHRCFDGYWTSIDEGGSFATVGFLAGRQLDEESLVVNPCDDRILAQLVSYLAKKQSLTDS